MQLNGFDSFLALRGIRYDDKNEFFSSLETTVVDTLNLPDDTNEKRTLVRLFGENLNFKQFKLKPGHRNLIMNLMLEIDKVDVEEFFTKAHIKASQNKSLSIDEMEMFKSPAEQKVKHPEAVKSSPNYSKSPVVYQIADHVYSNDEAEIFEYSNEPEYVEEENAEYLFEECIEEKSGISYVLKLDESDSEKVYEATNSPKKKPSKKRKPDRMYNEEFLSQSMNPRRRRILSTKVYPDNDDGIRERFADLIQQVILNALFLNSKQPLIFSNFQSMQCILSQSKLERVQNVTISIFKETDTSWIVVCPLCDTKIKMAVVFENNGRYRNYKRSNFERHLRFKHCKEDKIAYEAVQSIQEY